MKNMMKYFCLAVLAFAATAMTSCEKDEPAYNGDGVHFSTTVKLAGSTKALDADGHKTFAKGDQIAVIYKNTSGATVKAVSDALATSDIESGGKVAKFSVDLESPDMNEEVTYIYPAFMAKADGTVNYDALYTSQNGKLDTLAKYYDYCTYTGAWSAGNLPANVTLTNGLAICKFTINDFTSTITRLTIKNGSDIYIVNTSSLSDIWVAMKPVTTGDITVYAAKGKELYKKTVSNKTLNAGKLYPVTVNPTLIPGALSGLFRIGNDLFYFSKGNLQATTTNNWTTWTFSFMEHQYSIVEKNGTSYCTTNYGNRDTVSLFSWGTSGQNHGAISYQPYSTDMAYQDYYAYGDYTKNLNDSPGTADWGYTEISNGGNAANMWHTPTSDEWGELFANHTYGMAIVNGVHGIVILPLCNSVTGFNSSHESWNNNTYNASEWTSMETEGAVFLPVAGARSFGVDIYYVGEIAYYWSSTVRNNDEANALYFDYLNVFTTQSIYRNCGCSVRLINR